MAGVTYDVHLPVAIAVVWVIVYAIYLAVTRLYFSPISHIPGPKLFAISGWPEFYYDYFKGGKYVFEIKKMHEIYGTHSLFFSNISAYITPGKAL
jgi:hypothetical protein